MSRPFISFVITQTLLEEEWELLLEAATKQRLMKT
jgi:hypothetical protein